MSHVQSQGQWRPECVICKESVPLEESKVDEYGKAVHQECTSPSSRERQTAMVSPYKTLA
jgi:hypothetical protein